MTNSIWPQISQTTLADQVYQAVRDRILSGDLGPGEYIREQDLSNAMGVSRTPVREALGRLASESFLERIPHRGFRVPEESFSRLLELYPIVGALEYLAGQLAFPNLGDDDFRQLHEINERLRAAMDRDDVQAAMEINHEFHHLIAARSDNERLTQLLDDLLSQLTRLEIWYYSSRGRAEESVREHDELIAALEAGDIDEALDMFEGHMRGTATALDEDAARAAIADGLPSAASE